MRLGCNGASEIKSHLFFEGVDWDNIKYITPPFGKPRLSVTNFSERENVELRKEI